MAVDNVNVIDGMAIDEENKCNKGAAAGNYGCAF